MINIQCIANRRMNICYIIVHIKIRHIIIDSNTVRIIFITIHYYLYITIRKIYPISH